MTKNGTPRKYINIVQDMYREVKTNVRTCGRAIQDFPMTIVLHQVSSLSHFLFVAVLNEIARSFQGGMPWCILFVKRQYFGK